MGHPVSLLDLTPLVIFRLACGQMSHPTTTSDIPTSRPFSFNSTSSYNASLSLKTPSPAQIQPIQPIDYMAI
ncbi:hypothetical protein QBC42DRAFT_271554 [Cladorrhinum samala]|uniref:Uncharacterized protein n=1 Tax=Cladorrhinum samala TaxID=585594 RepID=A0AAV9HJ49_9PEZI|nr:hypothetical protein QBC42DRAFT_271554 [Cladorrhinum samala]